jgi:hypothetical protein
MHMKMPCLKSLLGLGDLAQFQNYHRVRNRAQGATLWGARRLLQALLQAFGSRGPLVFGLDETLERRWGRRIAARGVYRDAPLQQGGHQ